MKKEISPAIMWGAVIVVVLLAVFFGYKMMSGPPPEMDKKTGDATMERVKAGGPMYTAPPGAIRRSGPGAPPAGAPGGFTAPSGR